MTARKFAKSVVEAAALAWLESLGFTVKHGPDIAAGMLGAERSDRNYRGVLREAARMTPVCVLSP